MPSPQGQQYAQLADLQTYGLAAGALTHPSTNLTAVNAALLAASETVDGYLRNQFTLPLKIWGADIVKYTCWIAQYDLISVRGFNPAALADENYVDRYDRAMKWLKDVSEGKSTPDVVDSSSNAAPGLPTPDAQPQGNTASPINFTGGTTRGTSSR